MAFKLIMSERSINMMDNCILAVSEWPFDAINAPILLEQLLSEPKSNLQSYLRNNGVGEDEDIFEFTALICSSRMQKVEVKDTSNVTNSDSQGETTKKDEKNQKEKQYASEHDSDIELEDEYGKKHRYPISQDVLNIFLKLTEFCVKNKIEKTEPVHILTSMFLINSEPLRLLFSDLDVNYQQARKYFTENQSKKAGIIPYALSVFLECLNDKVDVKKPCEILGRDKEVEKIWNVSLKRNKRNTIIVGEAGVGKSALIEKITYEIVKGTCPKEFLNFLIISLDVNSLIAGTRYRGQAEERIKGLIEFLKEHNNVILFIDEVHTILGAGSCRDGEMDLANALKPILARGDTIVIGATTDNEYDLYFAQDAALSRRFERVDVEEPNSNEVWPMIKNKVKALSKYHNVKISQSMVEHAIMIANCFAFNKKNPDKTLDLIDRCMVVAKRNGKDMVDEESIMANFNIYFELYDGMEEDSRKEVAYHESGHYIAFKALAHSIVEVRLLAVSILPAENYLGVTCYENRRDRMPFTNKEYYINHLAVDLAGRASEKVFRKDFTSGAGADLKSATALAYKVITSFGFSNKDDGGNNIFLNTPDYPMLSEKSVNSVNDAVKDLITIAYKKAEDIINDNMDFLKAMVKKLLAKGIMSEKELDKLWQTYQAKKSLNN